MKPIRVQLSRKKGWRMPPNTVKVTRPGKWGNPFDVPRCGTAAECVEQYRKMVDGNRWTHPNRREIQEQLRGKNLACFCKLDAPCHADVLLEIANEEKGSGAV